MTPWTVAHQAPLSVEFPRQEYRSGLPFPSPQNRPNPGIVPASPVLAGRFFITAPSGKPTCTLICISFSTCLFITSFSESKKLASPYLCHIYLLVQLEDILSFKIAKLYSHETQIYQLHCCVCVQFFVSLSYIFKQNIVFQSYLGQLNFPPLPSVRLCHTFVKPIQFLQNFTKFVQSALYCEPPNSLVNFLNLHIIKSSFVLYGLFCVCFDKCIQSSINYLIETLS